MDKVRRQQAVIDFFMNDHLESCEPGLFLNDFAPAGMALARKHVFNTGPIKQIYRLHQIKGAYFIVLPYLSARSRTRIAGPGVFPGALFSQGLQKNSLVTKRHVKRDS